MKKIVKIKRNAGIYFDVGEKKREEGKLNEAVYYFYLAYKNGKAEASVSALVEMGNTYCDMEKYNEAIKYYIIALDKAPLSADISSLIASAYSCLGEDDMSFFYIAPGMSLDRYNFILKETEEYEKFEREPVRVVEKGDEMTLNIAVKLFESGDNKYAAQVLDTIKPESNQFATASNMLTLYDIEQGNYEKAKKRLDLTISKSDNVLARCSQLLLLSKVNEAAADSPVFDDLKELGAEGIARKIESFRLTLNEQKSVALSFIRAKEPLRAIKHLSIILDNNIFDRDIMTCYALCLYECGMIDAARNAIFNAHYTFPEDAFISYFLEGIVGGQKGLGLGPRMPIEIERAYIGEIDKKLDIIYKGANTFSKDADFKKKLDWMYQAGYSTANNKASLILGREKSYHGFLRGLLLKDFDMQTKKVILFSLLLNGLKANFVQKIVDYKYKDDAGGVFDSDAAEEFFENGLIDLLMDEEEDVQEESNVIRGINFSKLKIEDIKTDAPLKDRKKKPEPEGERDFGAYVYKGRLGIVLDGFYTRLKIAYPKNMDLLFHTSYCAAFSSFVFCDSAFEDRLLSAALRALKKYNAPGFDKSQIKNEEVLAAALFFAAHHSEISTIRQCSQLFGCTQQDISDYLKILSLRQARKSKKEKN